MKDQHTEHLRTEQLASTIEAALKFKLPHAKGIEVITSDGGIHIISADKATTTEEEIGRALKEIKRGIALLDKPTYIFDEVGQRKVGDDEIPITTEQAKLQSFLLKVRDNNPK